ncbi:chalcone isomerase family protein [Cupriavidus basilensis]|uniref:Chalcone isomerase family protein n=1 Tax=Cupriavidus basilensis TaxID=68895 RepID=A0A643FZT8_9BURK|nr:chalcone isomerase family protein [Cupriavidus basilensis]QOT78727.1 chalcone isomerase family protein [Cupriavidus basilensis]
MRRVAAALAMALLCVPALAAAGWRADVQAARLSGEGEFRVFGFRLYTAQLWSAQLPITPDAPFALQLTYDRSIQRERLVETSLDEMKRIGSAGNAPPSPQLLDSWRASMAQAFVDVRPGDTLTGVFMPGKGVRFYAGDRLTTEIDDPAFAQAFFSIWLDPATRAPALRRRLLGLAQ